MKEEQYKNGLTGLNVKYDAKPNLGTYRTKETSYPEGMVKFLGVGANEEDFDRGYCKPALNELPEYDNQNYFYRWSEPKNDDLVEDGPGISDDYAFRNKDRVSKGFLTRPRIPTER